MKEEEEATEKIIVRMLESGFPERPMTALGNAFGNALGEKAKQGFSEGIKLKADSEVLAVAYLGLFIASVYVGVIALKK